MGIDGKQRIRAVRESKNRGPSNSDRNTLKQLSNRTNGIVSRLIRLCRQQKMSNVIMMSPVCGLGTYHSSRCFN
jgi:hypothetical protein